MICIIQLTPYITNMFICNVSVPECRYRLMAVKAANDNMRVHCNSEKYQVTPVQITEEVCLACFMATVLYSYYRQYNVFV